MAGRIGPSAVPIGRASEPGFGGQIRFRPFRRRRRRCRSRANTSPRPPSTCSPFSITSPRSYKCVRDTRTKHLRGTGTRARPRDCGFKANRNRSIQYKHYSGRPACYITFCGSPASISLFVHVCVYFPSVTRRRNKNGFRKKKGYGGDSPIISLLPSELAPAVGVLLQIPVVRTTYQSCLKYHENLHVKCTRKNVRTVSRDRSNKKKTR